MDNLCPANSLEALVCLLPRWHCLPSIALVSGWKDLKTATGEEEINQCLVISNSWCLHNRQSVLANPSIMLRVQRLLLLRHHHNRHGKKSAIFVVNWAIRPPCHVRQEAQIMLMVVYLIWLGHGIAKDMSDLMGVHQPRRS